LKKGKKSWLRVGALVLVLALSLSLLQPGVAMAATSSVTETSTMSESAVQKKQEPNLEEVKVTKEEAIEKLRKLFPQLEKAQPESVELGDTHSYPPSANQMVWSIHWNYQEGNSGYGFTSRVDAVTGDVLSIRLPRVLSGENEVYYPPKVSKEEAAELAKKFIAEAAPSIPLEQLSLEEDTYLTDQPLFGPVNYHLRFMTKVNGVHSPSETLYVTMNGDGQITDFHSRFSYLKYPSAEPSLSLEEAIKKYQESVQLSLHYIPNRRGDDVTWFLGWKPDRTASFSTIDAQSGQFLSNAGEPLERISTSFEDIANEGKSFSPVESDGEFITLEQAVDIAGSVVTIEEGKELSRHSMVNNHRNNEQTVWELSWSPDGAQFGPYGETYAVVDAQTGQLLRFEEERFRGPQPKSAEEEQKDKISAEEAKVKALQLIGTLYPNATEELKLVMRDPSIPVQLSEERYYFRFQRFYQGHPVEDDGVNMAFSLTGKLMNYNVRTTSGLEEKANDLEVNVSQEEAVSLYLEDTTVQLQYRQFRGVLTNDGYQDAFTKLVYQQTFHDGVNFGYAIDASNGDWKSSWGPEVEENEKMVEPVDIQNHWAKSELETLLQYQILKADSSGSVYPGKTLTMGEWLEMMAKAVQPRYTRGYYRDDAVLDGLSKESPYYDATAFAVAHNWLEEEGQDWQQLDEELTREDLAVSLVHILGYNKLATYTDNSTHVPFDDADQMTVKGAVVIVQQLGLMIGTDGNFSPNAKVTRAEAATVMMRLVYLQGKTDRTIGEYSRW
jgi:Zn-dependent metalloprotease